MLLFRPQPVGDHKLLRAAQPRILPQALLHDLQHGALTVDALARSDFRADLEKGATMLFEHNFAFQLAELHAPAAMA